LGRYKTIRFSSKLWKPNIDLTKTLTKILKGRVKDGDIIVLSEKALAVALGFVFDEKTIKPSKISKIFTFLWMRIVWGLFLAPLCRLKSSTINWIRNYPLEEGSAHKQLTLRVVGLIQTLKPSSEGGIDGSNLPGRLVALPIKNLKPVLINLRKKLVKELGVNLTFMVVDSDRVYILRNRKASLIISTRKTCYKEIVYMGFLAYILGRIFRRFFRPNATPLLVVGEKIPVNEALIMAEKADRVRGYGAGRTVFEMAENLKTSIDKVTWEMLEKIRHYPIVVIRKLS
jgi:F420-0:gamma-glutamyl ligase-like protein